jgi:hypothetical protein
MKNVDLINKGLKLTKTHREVQNGNYFLKKYDINSQIAEFMEDGEKVIRKRDEKAQRK